MFPVRGWVRFLFLLLVAPVLAQAARVKFDLPAQPAAEALLAFSRQADVEVLFPYDDLARVTSSPVQGEFEPESALIRLLGGTGFAPRRNHAGKFIVSAPPTNYGVLRGRLLLAGGEPAAGITVHLGTRFEATTDGDGNFEFTSVPAGDWQVQATAPHHRPLELVGLRVEAHRTLTLAPQRLLLAGEILALEPYVVRGEGNSLRNARDVSLVTRRAAGNIDLPRTRDDALPYAVYTREQIARSGVINLNQFLQRELLDSDATATPSEKNPNTALVATGSGNLQLRGFQSDETVIFVNGRRLPETLQPDTGVLGAPDVNLIPLGLIQQVEVLPVSAAALYGGNAVGGVINIVLRPDIDTTEISATYTNAVARYDAPETSFSLQHGQSLLGGRLRLRLNFTSSSNLPPTEAELGLLQARAATNGATDESLYRATPNVRSASGAPLFGAGSSRFTSVAPGANGSGGLAAFAGRSGVRSTVLFDGPGGMANSPVSRDYAYGRRQRRDVIFGSITGDPFPWLQLGLDISHSRAVISRGANVFSQDLTLAAGSPFNPFGQEVIVSLNESPTGLGTDYGEARLQMTSAVFGALVKLPADWRVSLDTQYSRSITRLRGLVEADPTNWQRLVNEGKYNPLRDTQVFDAPADFYNQVLVYRQGRGEFITLSDYDTFDTALRIANQSVAFPTGRAVINAGGDYRRTHLSPFTDYRRYGDGGLVGTTQAWTGRVLERYSAFGEMQAPLLPASRLPEWLTSLEGDLAVRGIASDRAGEAYLAPMFALKAEFAGGLAFRGSVSGSNRFPTPRMSGQVPGAGGSGGGGSEGVLIKDPVLNESYIVASSEPLDPGVRTEAALTQAFGLILQRGKVHRVRAGLDFVDTQKTDELFTLYPQSAVDLEALFPQHVVRNASGRITFVATGNVNAARRHSQNWNLSLDYDWTQCFGGTLQVYGRWMHFQKYDRQLLVTSPVVDELNHPDGTAPNLLRDRFNFGTGWTRHANGFGFDGHYFGPRRLPENEWASQGSDHVAGSWQFDAWLQRDLRPWLPWKERRYGLQAQLRIDNLFDAGFPHYANAPSGAGVQPYGDWRGRTYALSLTATF